MKITKQFVEKIGSMYNQKPCNEGIIWFNYTFHEGSEHRTIFQRAINEKHFDYATWALSNLMKKEKNVEWAIWCAEQVLPIFEDKYPNDDRPRKAIEAAKEYLKNPCDKTEERAAWTERALAAWEAAAWAELAEAWEAEEAESAWTERALAAAWAAWAALATAALATAERVAWAAEEACKANPALSMQILQKGFEIWRTK